MEITPRYDTEPIVRLDGPPSAVAVPLVRQRRRLAAIFESLNEEELATQSRCEEWRIQDVASHLAGVDMYWVMSVTAGLDGAPTRLLAGFDPKATPAAIVAAKRDTSATEIVAGCVANIDAFCALVAALDEAAWTTPVETPLGHVSVTALAHHALWDSWVHERDVLIPLGRSQEQHDDELAATLRYAAALSPAFGLQTGKQSGAVAFNATEPDLRVTVTVTDSVEVSDGPAPDGALVIDGRTADLIEALSVRQSFGRPIPAEQAWLVTSLGEVFEAAPSA